MHIKRFSAPTMLEAVQQVKAALGPDALVLDTRTVRKGQGPFGLLGRTWVEVTAAAERSEATTDSPESRRSTRAAAPHEGEGRVDANVARELRALRERIDGLDRAGANQDEALQELAELRAWTAELARGRRPEGEGPIETRLAGHLLAGGLAPRHAWVLGRAAAARPEVGQDERAALAAALRAELDDRMLPPRADDGIEVEFFVGPTGAGKTTTLAKLAARGREEPGGVALVTTDVHRLGAVEQLERYAGSLGVPFATAGDAEALGERIRARPARRVLVDTAGRSADPEALAGLRRLRDAAGGPTRVSLVLSATAGAEQLAHERERYAPLGPEALVLTKLDECVSFAPAANLLLDETTPPLSWTATGQRVPEDLRVAEPEPFAHALLGVEGRP